MAGAEGRHDHDEGGNGAAPGDPGLGGRRVAAAAWLPTAPAPPAGAHQRWPAWAGPPAAAAAEFTVYAGLAAGAPASQRPAGWGLATLGWELLRPGAGFLRPVWQAGGRPVAGRDDGPLAWRAGHLVMFAYLALTAYLGWLLCSSGRWNRLTVSEEER